MRGHRWAASRQTGARSDPRRRSNRPSLQRLPLAFAFLIGMLLVGMFGMAGAASAETSGHAYSFAFGSLGSGNGQFTAYYGMGIAVDQSNGDVYVTDDNNYRIEKFDAAGNFLEAWGWGVKNGANESQICVAPETCQAGHSGAGPGEFKHPDAIAVDNSGGENDGDVYVADSSSPAGEEGLEEILKFDENGNYLGTIDGSTSPVGKFTELSWTGAIGVDGQGYLWAQDGRATVLKFSNESDNEYVGGSMWEAENRVWALGVNRAGTKLAIETWEGVFPINSNGTNRGGFFPGCGGYFAGDVTIAGNDHAFVGNGGTVCEFTLTGQMVGQPFGSGILCSVNGIAVNDATGVVYAADPCNSQVYAFKPRIVPNVTTGPATNVGHTSATLTGEAAPDPSGGGEVSGCDFEIGTDTSYGTTIPCEPTTPYGGPTPVHADVSGLTMDTTYHYRIAAKNSIDTNYGSDRTFTPHRVLGLTTNPASDVAQTSVTLNGSFEPNGEDTHYFFEWGTTESYGNATTTELVPSSTPGMVMVHADLSGLSTYTKYHYRIVASNSLGNSDGADEVFHTEAASPPFVTETQASAVTDAAAHLSGMVNPNDAATIYRFQFGMDASYGRQTPVSEPIGEDGSPHAVSADISGLEPGTTYHFRLMATNFGGTTLGPDVTFTTKAAPVVQGASASEIGPGDATLEATVNPELSVSTAHFEYGETTDYGTSTPEVAVGADDSGHTVRAPISGLLPNTTYHFRAVASNAIGITHGSDQTFTTSNVPAAPPLPPPPARCKRGFVKKHGRCVRRHGHRKRRKHGVHSRRGHG